MTRGDRTGFYPWLVWGLAASFYCYGFFQRVAPSVMVGELMSEFSVSAAVLGNLSAFYFYAYASLQLPIGIRIDHWGAKRMLVGAALLCGAGSLLFAKADSLTMAYAGRLLIGAGAGFTWVGTLKLTAQWLPPKRFAMVSGMTLMLGMIGAVAGQAPLAAAVAVFGWRDTLSVAAFVAIALAALIWLISATAEPSRLSRTSSPSASVAYSSKSALWPSRKVDSASSARVVSITRRSSSSFPVCFKFIISTLSTDPNLSVFYTSFLLLGGEICIWA